MIRPAPGNAAGLRPHHGPAADRDRADRSGETVLRVTGMQCAGCAASVQKAVESRPGVISASVSFTDGLATVVGEGVDLEDLARVIRDRGFEAEPVDPGVGPAALLSEIEVHQIEHERQWRRRAIVGLGIWIPMALLHWVGGGLLGLGEAPWLPWVLLAGATAVLLTAGAGFYRSALAAARRRTTNMDTLIAIGATAAYGFSVVVQVAHLGGRLLDQPLYFTEAAALLGIISLGHWLEARSAARAGSAVRELLQLQPDEAERLEGSDLSVTVVPSAEVAPGDRLLIRPGARVPVDGVVVDGESSIDESVVTGEPMPVDKRPGDAVVAGSVNTAGRLVVEATVDGRHTTVTRIADMVRRAQGSRAAIQRLADRVSAVFVPSVLGVAAATFLGWWAAGHLVDGLIASVTVMIISCPCALGLATPMAVMVGAGAASRRGILVKSAAALEEAGRTRHVVFDKTGTLTRGEPAVTAIEVEAGSGLAGDELLRLAASVEASSEHPIAGAIMQEATRRGQEPAPAQAFEALPGQGVRATVEGRRVEVRRDAAASCRVVVDGRPAGTVTVADTVRPDAPAAVARLRAMGLEVSMISGDRETAVREVGAAVGIDDDHLHARATPEGKCELVERLTAASGGALAMVGDGINDAAALARAGLGVAIASGTNIAMESADVVIPGHQVMAVPDAIDLARRTLRTIRQNLFFAFFYNVCAVPAAAFGLLGLHGPIIAAIAMAGSDLTVIGNALRLKRALGVQRRSGGEGTEGQRD